jgi:hypothetical protein
MSRFVREPGFLSVVPPLFEPLIRDNPQKHSGFGQFDP